MSGELFRNMKSFPENSRENQIDDMYKPIEY